MIDVINTLIIATVLPGSTLVILEIKKPRKIISSINPPMIHPSAILVNYNCVLPFNLLKMPKLCETPVRNSKVGIMRK